MKSFRNSPHTLLTRLGIVALAVIAAGWLVHASGELPSWVRNIEAKTAVEAAFFRMMQLPGGPVLFRRPPSETRPALSDAIKAQPKNSDLYSLRAMEDEQQLDFPAAEADWKLFAGNASDKMAAQISLADFYHRRLRPLDEIKTLSVVANAPPELAEKLTPVNGQRSWQAFERIFKVIQSQGLPKDVSVAQYRAWIGLYPAEGSLYARFLEYLIAQKDYGVAGQIIADYHKQFPSDEVFPVKAKALVEYRQGSVQQGLAVYEQSFQPLWPPELVKSYFDLLTQTKSLRKYLDQARAALNANPEDLNATARIFYYHQQQGKLEAAQQAITALRLHKEAAKSAWTAQELYVCARLLDDIHSYPEAARYYFALYNSKGMNDAQERAIAGLTNILLTAPEAPIRLGSGELSLYRDIATMDQGPGYLNGILSLLLNSDAPASNYSEEEQRAVPYFHRSRAAELLALLDTKFPNSPRRPELHNKLLEFYANSGESEAVIRGGREFLAAFPNASQRMAVGLLMADAYARTGKTTEEFSIYDSVLQELAAKAEKVPLGTGAGSGQVSENSPDSSTTTESSESTDTEEAIGEEGEGTETSQPSRQARRPDSQAFKLSPTATARQVGARSPEYARVLERYLGRLVQLKQIPRALTVLRNEIERNPDDPGLYERLASFLDQNQLGSEQEEIYKRAIARFPDRSWYHKLARFYLRSKRNSDFERLTQEVVKTFSGTDLERYMEDMGSDGGPQMSLRVNQYANQRFPHDPVFVRNLLGAYHSTFTYNEAAWLALLRQHWFEEAGLRNTFFEYLSRTGELEAELSTLRQTVPDVAKGQWEEMARANPAAVNFVAQADLWQSRFEDSAPLLKALEEQYPADVDLGRTASSVYRSLAYYDPAKTAIAAKIEDNLLQADPGNTEILGRIGDIYADRELFAQAAPYWERIPQVAPGESSGYLEAATIYWDYFDFDNAMRLLNDGRKKLHNDDLYSYEAGAIHENRRDYPHAIEEYVKGALAGGNDSPAALRLFDLARRPKFRDLVERDTAKFTTGTTPAMEAVYLRVRVLEAQDRKQELEGFLDSIATGTTSIEQAEDIENLAQQKSLEAVRQHALEKQAALTTDPVTRLQIRYSLVQLYESKKDFQAAQRNVEALYRENPKLMGVVRATVDFYWRMKMYPQAIGILSQASKDAYPELALQFTFEAARKSTEAGQYQTARDLLAKLLKDSPYDGQYLAAMADTYAQSSDDHGLQQFYLEKIALFRNAPFSTDERKARIATLRRGLIPALARMKDYTGAVDQYIELLNNFPEDEGLVTEAALFALRYQQQQKLVDFYSKTVQQSPRDYRWAMVLARIQTDLENFPAAIETYGKALTIRPDRVDLRTARAGLSERLMRFDDAAADYERIYQLAYKDPKWMEKVAEVRARQQKADDTVAALKIALIEGHPQNASSYFEVARRLESWGMLPQAQSFAEQGVSAAGAELLANSEQHSGANLYARILTRLRQPEKAYSTLQSALLAASSALPVAEKQVEKEGIAAVTDKEWRERTLQNRIDAARSGMSASLSEMGNTVARNFTPEEKVTFAKFAATQRASMNSGDLETFAIPLAQSSGLADLEARWRYELMMQPAASSSVLLERMRPFVELQRRRLKFGELGTQLEQFAPRLDRDTISSAWSEAANAYRSAGEPEKELAMLRKSSSQGTRFLELLFALRPQELVQEASNWGPWGDTAAAYAVSHGDASMVHAVVAGRSRKRNPVWTRSYNALVGLYFTEATPAVNGAFLEALGDSTIGQRLGKPVDRSQQLAGNIWFYYGSRYGEYLGVTKQGTPEDFLPAMLERSPASSSGYLTLADYYMGSGDTRSAIADYNHTLELTPRRADVHDRLALAYYKQGDRAQALAQWKQALSNLAGQVDSARVPESFWGDFGRVCEHLRTRKLFSDLRPEADTLLRAYLRRNGNYRSNALLHSAYSAAGGGATATAWLLDLSSVAHDPVTVVVDVIDVQWIPMEQRGPIYQRILEAKQTAVLKAQGLEKGYAEQDLRSWQVRWVQYLVGLKQYAQAGDAINSLPQETRTAEATTLIPLELQVAAMTGTFDAKIASYRTEPQNAPAAEILRRTARQLFDAGDKQSARKILEFVFAREIDEHQLAATNFLGLAEIRIAAGDVPGTLDLLRRLVVAVGAPFENLDSAAALLEKTGHNAEATEFLEQLVKTVPWEPSYQMRLSKAKLAAGQDVTSAQESLTKIASSSAVPYELRAEAAMTGIRAGANLGSKELNMLSGGAAGIVFPLADQPFFYEARMKAAANSSDARIKLMVLMNTLADTPARDTARVPLFQVAVDARADEFALGALGPLLQRQFLNSGDQSSTSGDEEIIASDTEEETGQEDAETSAYSPLKLPAAQQAQVAWALGGVMMNLKRLDEALPYFELARKLEKTPTRRKEILNKIAGVKEQLRYQQLNAKRQPELHEALEQDRVVRPRLMARAAPSRKAAAKGGAQQ